MLNLRCNFVKRTLVVLPVLLLLQNISLLKSVTTTILEPPSLQLDTKLETTPDQPEIKSEISKIHSTKVSCRKVRYFQIYHISKCGGTNTRTVLRNIFHLEPPPTQESRWYFQDFGIWRREQENYPDPRYHRDSNNERKRKVFILGLVRNPFSYYRSLYIMLQDRRIYPGANLYLRSNGTQGSISQVPCPFILAFRHSKSHLFVGDHQYLTTNPAPFEEFMHLILGHASECYDDDRMQSRHDNMMLMNDGSIAYDAVIKQENYYPMLRQALEQFDSCMPNVTSFGVLTRLEKLQYRAYTRILHLKRSNAAFPDYCYYSSELREKVERSDGVMMERYNYSWESFVGSGQSVENNCVEVRNVL